MSQEQSQDLTARRAERYSHTDFPPPLAHALRNDPIEPDRGLKHGRDANHLDASGWEVLPALRLDQAAALPGTRDANGHLQIFTIGERLTPHVRHRQKYVDVPVTDSRAFVLATRRGARVRAHTLRELVAALESLDVSHADRSFDHLARP